MDGIDQSYDMSHTHQAKGDSLGEQNSRSTTNGISETESLVSSLYDDDSIISSGEMKDLDYLLECVAREKPFDYSRLYMLDLLYRWTEGESLNDEEKKHLINIRRKRRENRTYKTELRQMIEKEARGEMIDKERLYCLQLYGRRHIGEALSEEELQKLGDFEKVDQDLMKAVDNDKVDDDGDEEEAFQKKPSESKVGNSPLMIVIDTVSEEDNMSQLAEGSSSSNDAVDESIHESENTYRQSSLSKSRQESEDDWVILNSNNSHENSKSIKAYELSSEGGASLESQSSQLMDSGQVILGESKSTTRPVRDIGDAQLEKGWETMSTLDLEDKLADSQETDLMNSGQGLVESQSSQLMASGQLILGESQQTGSLSASLLSDLESVDTEILASKAIVGQLTFASAALAHDAHDTPKEEFNESIGLIDIQNLKQTEPTEQHKALDASNQSLLSSKMSKLSRKNPGLSKRLPEPTLNTSQEVEPSELSSESSKEASMSGTIDASMSKDSSPSQEGSSKQSISRMSHSSRSQHRKPDSISKYLHPSKRPLETNEPSFASLSSGSRTSMSQSTKHTLASIREYAQQKSTRTSTRSKSSISHNSLRHQQDRSLSHSSSQSRSKASSRLGRQPKIPMIIPIEVDEKHCEEEDVLTEYSVKSSTSEVSSFFARYASKNDITRDMDSVTTMTDHDRIPLSGESRVQQDIDRFESMGPPDSKPLAYLKEAAVNLSSQMERVYTSIQYEGYLVAVDLAYHDLLAQNLRLEFLLSFTEWRHIHMLILYARTFNCELEGCHINQPKEFNIYIPDDLQILESLGVVIASIGIMEDPSLGVAYIPLARPLLGKVYTPHDPQDVTIFMDWSQYNWNESWSKVKAERRTRKEKAEQRGIDIPRKVFPPNYSKLQIWEHLALELWLGWDEELWFSYKTVVQAMSQSYSFVDFPRDSRGTYSWLIPRYETPSGIYGRVPKPAISSDAWMIALLFNFCDLPPERTTKYYYRTKKINSVMDVLREFLDSARL